MGSWKSYLMPGGSWWIYFFNQVYSFTLSKWGTFTREPISQSFLMKSQKYLWGNELWKLSVSWGFESVWGKLTAGNWASFIISLSTFRSVVFWNLKAWSPLVVFAWPSCSDSCVPRLTYSVSYTPAVWHTLPPAPSCPQGPCSCCQRRILVLGLLSSVSLTQALAPIT